MNNFFIMMVGIPGSGKSYYANKYLEENKFDLPTVIISSDDYRKRLFGDENDQTHNSVLFNIINSDIRKYLISGVNVIFDATNTSLKNRLNTLRNIHGVNCDKIAWVIATPVDKCIEQDKNRERSVGVDVINKFVRSYQFPQKFEGFNHIWINDYREKSKSYVSQYDELITETKIAENIDKRNLKPYYVDLYNTVMLGDVMKNQYTTLGNEMLHTIGHNHRRNPPLAAAIPPTMPPMVSPMTPTVPWTKPNSDVDRPSPPVPFASSINKGQILVSIASGKR